MTAHKRHFHKVNIILEHALLKNGDVDGDYRNAMFSHSTITFLLNVITKAIIVQIKTNLDLAKFSLSLMKNRMLNSVMRNRHASQ